MEVFWTGLVVVIIVGFVLMHVIPPTDDEATLPEPTCAHCEALLDPAAADSPRLEESHRRLSIE